MNTLQQKLDIPREMAKRLGIQTVEILEAGYYETKAGKRIDIKDAVLKSVNGTITYYPEIALPISAAGHFPTQIKVLNTTTLAAVSTFIAEGFYPAVLNMASATSPGGGFLSGARAQEEYLARSSALYACLRNNPMYSRIDFYTDPFYADFVIYSPDVLVFRDDDGELVERPYTCPIISSPAVQAHAVQQYMPQRAVEIEGIMWQRILKVLSAAFKHNLQALVLGAWGCGAFGNDGDQIAGLFKKALAENFKGAFEHVVFAIADWSSEGRFIGPFIRQFQV